MNITNEQLFDVLKTVVTIDEDGTKHWYVNDKLHRIDGPAIEWSDGVKWWYLNGLRHRIDGPAIEYSYGDNHWYINGKQLTEDEYNKRTTT